MAGFWKDFAGGFSQNSRDDNRNMAVTVSEFDRDVSQESKQPSSTANSQKEEDSIDKQSNEEIKKKVEIKEKEIKEIKEIKKKEEKNITDTIFTANEGDDSNESETIKKDVKKGQVEKEMELNNRTIITKSTIIAGNISTEDDLIIEGSVCGDVDCKGKLTISGEVSGNAVAKAISINTSKFEGDVRSDGRIEIKEGTVIIGNIYGDEALISGAVKGEIVVSKGARLEKTAIVKGNIKAKSVQIDNGAVLQGYCELQYDNIDLVNLFGEDDKEEEKMKAYPVDDESEGTSLEEELERELDEEAHEKEEAALKALQSLQKISEEDEEEQPAVQVQEIAEEESGEDTAKSEDDREAYMQEMEDNYSNFMEQLQMDSES